MVTLEHVALQLGLRIDDKPVTGPTFFDWDELCYELLGFLPLKGEALVGSSIKLKWLRDHTIALPDEPTEQQLHQHCRAYILGLIDGVIMPDKSGNRIHLMYLPLLADLERARRYSWGSACLAHLYREMCRAIYPSSKKMGGCSLLLQSWAWYRMSFIQPRAQRDITFLLASRYGLIFIPL
nr:Serine/threonine protein phosphatase 7 long form isogeny [Cajanus cajan]